MRVAWLGLSGVVACSLTTSLDGFVQPPADGVVPPSAEAGTDSGPEPTKDGGVVTPPGCAENINLQANEQNCGRCGHDCLGGRCERGKCQPHRLASGFTDPIGVTLAGDFLWVGHAQGLDRVPLEGGDPTRIASTPGIGFVTSTATDVFWASGAGNAIRRVPVGGGESAVVKGSVENIFGIALSPSFVFFSRPDQKLLQRIPFTTTESAATPEDLATDLDVSGIAWAGGSLFAAAYNAGVVVEIADDGKGARREIMKGGRPFGVAVDGDDVFVTRGEAFDLVRVPRGGGTPEVLASGLDGPGGIVLTATAFYFTEIDGKRLVRLAR